MNTSECPNPPGDVPVLRSADYGFFGPDSVTWRVWTHPTALLGFQRSVVLEQFDPYLAAAVADQAGMYTDPRGRLDRTLGYFLTVAVGDSRTALAMSGALLGVHARATGIEPITGRRYRADHPVSQLWIHVTGWHSVLKCYEMYGPGRLSPADEARYWADCAVAAELQTCDAEDVPRSRAELHAYYDTVRPQLCCSERAQRAMHYVLHTPLGAAGPVFWGASHLAAPATIATLPRWMRRLGGFDQPDVVSAAVRPATRAVIAGLTVPSLADLLLPLLAPTTATILQQHRMTGVPAAQEITTPAAARLHRAATVAADTVGHAARLVE
ncbi:oxygenase MpaB family protein [Tsukamurella soli]|uniref:Oxygenase MpaB family protein n=1 Tax=Tsukamurella soli TaxID=644556 RepID=A0ABP8JAH9_9ACTN